MHCIFRYSERSSLGKKLERERESALTSRENGLNFKGGLVRGDGW